MRLLLTLLLTSAIAAHSLAAPAPFPKEPRRVPSPQVVMDRLRAEGYSVGSLRHEGGDRWTLDVTAMMTSNRQTGMRMKVERHIIVAPGDPTAKLREVLEKKR